MTEFNVILQKTRIAEILVEAKNKKEAGEAAMEIYEDGNADWSSEAEVEVIETEEI